MRIVVTGGNGKLGRYLVAELAREHEVIVLDQAGEPSADVEFVRGDMLDMKTCKRALEGAEVVIHLGAIPHPLSDPPERVWRVNTCSTYNIHEAAASLGVRRVVQASSDSTLGFWFRTRDIEPLYAPIDEAHPCRPQDAYGLGKLAAEQIAQSYGDRVGLETVALRICLVLFPDQAYCRNLVKKLRSGPAGDSKGLWAYNHVLDAVQAFRLAAETPGLGNEVMFISAADVAANEDTLDLLRKYHPSVTDIRGDLSGRRSLIDYSKAAAMLGYEPKYSWRDIPVE